MAFSQSSTNFLGWGLLYKYARYGRKKSHCILDSGALSAEFNLETFRPQGEIISPNTYNISNQILLFRIELDKNVPSVFQHMRGPSLPFPFPKNDLPVNQVFLNKSNRKTDKSEGFADDTTVITICEEKSIIAIKNLGGNLQ